MSVSNIRQSNGALIGNVDGDGDLDVVTSEQLSNSAPAKPQLGVIWYENPAPPRVLQR